MIEYILRLRTAGGVVNTAVVMASLRGIVLSHDRTLLEENGGYIKFSKALAISLLHRMNFVKRNGSTSAKLFFPKNLKKYVMIFWVELKSGC